MLKLSTNVDPVKIKVKRDRICNVCNLTITKHSKAYFWSGFKCKDAYSCIKCLNIK